MKCLICYFSTTGNTKLACDYIVKKIPDTHFEFFNIANGSVPEFELYDLIGFATFADFLAPPKLMQDFIKVVPFQKLKPAFVFNTYGNFNGRTLRIMELQVKSRGFNVVAGYALNTPENVPPLVAGPLPNTQYPNEKQMAEFNQFIDEFKGLTKEINQGQKVIESKIRYGVLNRILSPFPRKIGRITMGKKLVDEALCNECGLCHKGCPYQAITMNPKPVFDQSKCYGCWACYNHCPTQAIHTKTMKHKGHYPKPITELQKKLGQ